MGGKAQRAIRDQQGLVEGSWINRGAGPARSAATYPPQESNGYDILVSEGVVTPTRTLQRIDKAASDFRVFPPGCVMSDDDRALAAAVIGARGVVPSQSHCLRCDGWSRTQRAVCDVPALGVSYDNQRCSPSCQLCGILVVSDGRLEVLYLA